MMLANYRLQRLPWFSCVVVCVQLCLYSYAHPLAVESRYDERLGVGCHAIRPQCCCMDERS